MARILALVAALLMSGGPTATERPAGTLVFASDDNRLTAVDVASGRRVARRIGSVPACGAQLFVTGGHIVFSGIADGVTTVYSLPLSLDRRQTRLGAAHMFVPSATDGRVWLAGTDCDRVRMVGVRELTVDGDVTFESERRVPGTYVLGAVPDGLVVNRRRSLFVWDPVQRVLRRVGLEWAFGADGSVLAGCAAGSDCDDLTVVDTASGRTVPVPGDLDMGPAVAPGGAALATPVRSGRRWRVALVDALSGAHRIIRGSWTGRAYPELRWSRSSGWLFIRANRRLRAYRPGAPRASVLPIRLPRSTIAFAVG